MVDVDFQVTGVEPMARGLTPLLQFKLQLSCAAPGQEIQGVLLHAQIQFQAPQRTYSPAEQEKLLELFGPPENWGQTLRNRLWTHANTTVGGFRGSTKVFLPVPCSFDLNLAATKYLYALEAGDIPLLFLFSGSVFYPAPDGRPQINRISWNKECVYRMPLALWRELMESHYPNSAWLSLRRDVFDRLYAHKRHHGLATWEHTIEHLLESAEAPGAVAPVRSGGEVLR